MTDELMLRKVQEVTPIPKKTIDHQVWKIQSWSDSEGSPCYAVASSPWGGPMSTPRAGYRHSRLSRRRKPMCFRNGRGHCQKPASVLQVCTRSCWEGCSFRTARLREATHCEQPCAGALSTLWGPRGRMSEWSTRHLRLASLHGRLHAPPWGSFCCFGSSLTGPGVRSDTPSEPEWKIEWIFAVNN